MSKHYANKLASNGVETLAQLLWKLPRDYVQYLDRDGVESAVEENSRVQIQGEGQTEAATAMMEKDKN